MSGGDITEDQEPLVAFLSKPGVLADAAPSRISTHGAHIFLAGRAAYKLKRAIRFDYMDFGTCEKRDAAAAAELTLNRRTAPDLYLGLLPVYADGDGFKLGAMVQTPDPDPAAVANLVVMRRFGDDATFDRLAETGGLDGWMIDRLADRTAAFHEAAKPVFRSAAATQLARISGRTIKAILDGQDIVGERVAVLLNHAMQGAIVHAMSEVDDRGAAGCVKRLHGDLHLGNVALFEGEPLIFDALEFNDAMATVDVLHDLAFLVMDLWARGQAELAARAWSRYLANVDDYSGLGLAPLFVAMRAAVRAKVAIDRARLESGDARARSEAEARRYVDAARRALDPPTARLVAIGGLSGAGKTTLARRLAPDFAPAVGAVHLRSDILRKRRAGVSFDEALPSEAYSPEASVAVYQSMLERAERALKQGAPVILDAVFAKPAEREAARMLAERFNVPFGGLWLDLPLDARQARIRARVDDASDATTAVAARQDGFDVGEIDWLRLAADDDVTDAARAALAVQTSA